MINLVLDKQLGFVEVIDVAQEEDWTIRCSSWEQMQLGERGRTGEEKTRKALKQLGFEVWIQDNNNNVYDLVIGKKTIFKDIPGFPEIRMASLLPIEVKSTKTIRNPYKHWTMLPYSASGFSIIYYYAEDVLMIMLQTQSMRDRFENAKFVGIDQIGRCYDIGCYERESLIAYRMLRSAADATYHDEMRTWDRVQKKLDLLLTRLLAD